MIFDRSLTSYGALLEIFLSSHNPCRPSFSDQYRSILFYDNDDQRKVAESALADVAERRKAKVHTTVLRLEVFHPAEDYHQKYYLRQDRKLFAAVEKIYPDPERLRTSTLAARANAYVGGHLTFEQFKEAVAKTGIPAAARTAVIESATP